MTRAVETRGDRVALAQDAGLGRVSLVSMLAGTLVAYGAFAVLLAVTAAVAKSAGLEADLSANEWRRLGTVGGVVVAAVLFVCYLFGGYVAGRMSRRAGSTHGFLVFVFSLVVAVGVTGLVNLFTDGEVILANLRNVGVPTSAGEWGDVGTVAGIASLAAMLVGSVIGGGLGERWHGRLLARALDPSVGAEAEAQAEAERLQAEAEQRRGESAERQVEAARHHDEAQVRHEQAEERVVRAHSGLAGDASAPPPAPVPRERAGEDGEEQVEGRHRRR